MFYFFLFIYNVDRSEEKIRLIEAYLRATSQLRDYTAEGEDPVFSQNVGLDLSTVVSSVSGPKRPNDRVSVSDMKVDFANCLRNKVCLWQSVYRKIEGLHYILSNFIGN